MICFSDSAGIRTQDPPDEKSGCSTMKSIKKAEEFSAFQVIPLGFEPRTHTLKVYCSTS